MVKQTDKPTPKKTTPAAKGSGMRRAQFPSKPATTPSTPAVDEDRIYALVRAVVEADGLQLDPEWVLAADAAERRGFVTRIRLQLFSTELGKAFVKEQSEPERSTELTMVKCTEHTRYQLKALAKEQGIGMRDALAAIIDVMYERRDELTRAARAAGREYAWDAIELAIRKK